MYVYVHVVRLHTQDMLSDGICGISAVKARNDMWTSGDPISVPPDRAATSDTLNNIIPL